MKKILIIILATFSISVMHGQIENLDTYIDQQDAATVAKNFMRQRLVKEPFILNIISKEEDGSTLYYIVNLEERGWVIVSADKKTVPVFAYSINGEYTQEEVQAEGLRGFMKLYKAAVEIARQSEEVSEEYQTKWVELLDEGYYPNPKKNTTVYTPGDALLNVNGRGHIRCGQDRNNDGGCSPAYNAHVETTSNSDCDCGAKPVGCGAVAMGQIMWYWQWPLASQYRTYNWGIMPDEVDNSTPAGAGDEVALLLKDCGTATNMTYWCAGSWTTVNKVEDAFNNDFMYQGIKKHVRNQWDYGDAWLDLLRSEIDNDRPVFYRGDKSDLSGEKHFFVLDGYDANDPNFFAFNFGWGRSSVNISYHYLNDLTPGSSEFNKNQMAVVGISPTYTEFPASAFDIDDVNYSVVSTDIVEAAERNISLPLEGKDLVVAADGQLELVAGNSITLNPGFNTNEGGEFLAHIHEGITGEMDITVPVWYNYITPNGDGKNDQLCIDVYNANSYEFTALNRNGQVIYQGAGSIIGDEACMWDGTGGWCLESFACVIRFKNNFGRTLENAYMVTIDGCKKKITI